MKSEITQIVTSDNYNAFHHINFIFSENSIPYFEYYLMMKLSLE
jgi:hypothetical protein